MNKKRLSVLALAVAALGISVLGQTMPTPSPAVTAGWYVVTISVPERRLAGPFSVYDDCMDVARVMTRTGNLSSCKLTW